ncbi:hypothetical protein L7F22_056262 [Adiantum nelumboides]|nr:hypothetical protein [Adiantum nelumboides]
MLFQSLKVEDKFNAMNAENLAIKKPNAQKETNEGNSKILEQEEAIKTTTTTASSRTTRSTKKSSNDDEKIDIDKDKDSKISDKEKDSQKDAEAKGPSEDEPSNQEDTSTPLDRKGKKPRIEEKVLLDEAMARVEARKKVLVDAIEAKEVAIKLAQKMVAEEAKNTRLEKAKALQEERRRLEAKKKAQEEAAIAQAAQAKEKEIIDLSDDYNRMTWVYFVKAKSEAFGVFLEFKVMVEKENGYHIKCLCTNGGGDYMSHSFDDYLCEQGIRRQITCKYTPQKNGVVERKNRVIAEIAKAMISEMSMPLTYWAEVVHTAAHIMNQTSTTTIHETSPYERLYGIKPIVSYMKVFECVCYVHVPNEARKKMEPKAMKCISLGYPVEKEGYKYYDPTTRQVYVSRDVKFFEHEPWYKPKPMTIEDKYEEQENVRHVVDEPRPSTRTISGPHMVEESTGSVNPWSGSL